MGRTTRRAASFCLAVLLLTVQSAAAATVTVADVSGAPGATGVMVALSADQAQGIAGGDLVLTYDAKALTARQARAADQLTAGGVSVVGNVATAGQVRIAMAGAMGLAAGSGALVQVTFDVLAGAAAGAYPLALQASLWDENGMALPTATKAGTFTVRSVATAASLTPSATGLTFDSTRVGATSRKTLTLTNAGTSSLTVSRIALAGTDTAQFQVTPRQFSLAGKASRALTVSFAPTAGGAKSARLVITHSGTRSPATVTLSGRGIAPTLSLASASLTFDSTQVGATAHRSLTLTNGTGTSLTVSRLSVSGTDAAVFTVSPTSFTLGGRASRVVTVTFAPNSAGAKSASLTIAYSGSGSPAGVALSGRGYAPSSLTAWRHPLTFDSTLVSATARKALTLSNGGSRSVTVSGITLSGADAAQFSVTPKTFTLAGKGTRSLSVSFTPASAGTKAAALSVAHNGSGSPLTVRLTGRGHQAAPQGLLVTVGSVSATRSSSITVLLSVNEAKGIAGGDLTLADHARVLTATQVRGADLLTAGGLLVMGNVATAGQVKIAMAGGMSLPAGSGAIVQVAFDVLSGAPSGPTVLSLEGSLWDENGAALQASFVSGAVTVKAGKLLAGEETLPGLGPAYPNPFNSSTVIPFALGSPQQVLLCVYDLAGQQVRVLVEAVMAAGDHAALWDGRDASGRAVGSGAYVCVLLVGGDRVTRRVLLLR